MKFGSVSFWFELMKLWKISGILLVAWQEVFHSNSRNLKRKFGQKRELFRDLFRRKTRTGDFDVVKSADIQARVLLRCIIDLSIDSEQGNLFDGDLKILEVMSKRTGWSKMSFLLITSLRTRPEILQSETFTLLRIKFVLGGFRSS